MSLSIWLEAFYCDTDTNRNYTHINGTTGSEVTIHTNRHVKGGQITTTNTCITHKQNDKQSHTRHQAPKGNTRDTHPDCYSTNNTTVQHHTTAENPPLVEATWLSAAGPLCWQHGVPQLQLPDRAWLWAHPPWPPPGPTGPAR